MKTRILNRPFAKTNAKHGRKAHSVLMHDTPAAFFKYCEDANGRLASAKKRGISRNRRFYGCENFEDALQKCRGGDPALQRKAKEMLNKLGAATLPDTSRRVKKTTKLGKRLNVGGYITDRPKQFVRRVKTKDDLGPINLVIDASSSGGIESRDLIKRGAALAALAYKLSSVRPVNLYLSTLGMAANVTSVNLVRFNAQPVDLLKFSTLCASQAFGRAFSFIASGSIADAAGKTSGGGEVFWPFNDPDYCELTRRKPAYTIRDDIKAILRGEDIVYFPGAYLGDPELHQILNNPESWIEARLSEYSNR